MKRHITIAVSVLCATIGAFAQSKTDAATQQILDAYRQKQLYPAAKVITPVRFRKHFACHAHCGSHRTSEQWSHL